MEVDAERGVPGDADVPRLEMFLELVFQVSANRLSVGDPEDGRLAVGRFGQRNVRASVCSLSMVRIGFVIVISLEPSFSTPHLTHLARLVAILPPSRDLLSGKPPSRQDRGMACRTYPPPHKHPHHRRHGPRSLRPQSPAHPSPGPG